MVTVYENQTLSQTYIGPKPSTPYKVSRAERQRLGRDNAALQKIPRVYQPAAVSLDATDVKRWTLAAEFLQSPKLLELDGDLSSPITRHLETELIVQEIANWPTNAGLLSKSFYSTWAAISFVVGLYGGLHVAAWDAHFPTFIEQVMWQASSILVATSGGLAFLPIVIDRLPSWGSESYIKRWWKLAGGGYTSSVHGFFLTIEVAVCFLVMLVIIAPLIVGIVAYVPARVFLVVESFVSLRDMPADVYVTPDWTQWIPHL